MPELTRIGLFCTTCGADLALFSAVDDAVFDTTHDDPWRRLFFVVERTIGDALRQTLCPHCASPARGPQDVEPCFEDIPGISGPEKLEAIMRELDALNEELDEADRRDEANRRRKEHDA